MLHLLSLSLSLCLSLSVRVVVYVDGEAVRAEILKQHKQRSVPAVFVKGKFVGGCNDGPESWMGALPLLNSGKLEEMLKEE